MCQNMNNQFSDAHFDENYHFYEKCDKKSNFKKFKMEEQFDNLGR